VLIYAANNNPALFSGSADSTASIPIFSLANYAGISLLCQLQENLQVTIDATINTEFYLVYTSNIIAETTGGDPNSIVFVGSHLDSVDAGPGINDNGSGSSLNLELALQLARLKINVQNKIRFAWWSAEELGLLGSAFYVNSLNNTDRQALNQIAIYINMDMVGSPNYFLGVYDGTAKIAPNGSAPVMTLFQNFFASIGQNSSRTDFNGRSDYGPFIAPSINIPAGGLFSGAEQIKTMVERQEYGGMANAQYDSCYHSRCDTVDNIDQGGFILFAQAAANVVAQLATTSNLRGFLGN